MTEEAPSAPPTLNFKHPAVWVATWFGLGLLKPASGTWGTLAGLPFGIALYNFAGWIGLLIGIVVVTLAGLWAADKVEAMTDSHDQGFIVIDEVAGVWIALLAAAPITFPHVALAFVLFRIFDIVKPFPVSWADQKIGGAWGVMLDDLLAGGYAALVIMGLRIAGIV
jgi:phosphatidylglycerophosphatase A